MPTTKIAAGIVESIGHDELLGQYELVYSHCGAVPDTSDAYNDVRRILETENGILWSTALEYLVLETSQSLMEKVEGREHNQLGYNTQPLLELYMDKISQNVIMAVATNGESFYETLVNLQKRVHNKGTGRKSLKDKDIFDEDQIGGLLFLMAYSSEMGFIRDYQSPQFQDVKPLPFTFYVRTAFEHKA
jgi:hypothetical protein